MFHHESCISIYFGVKGQGYAAQKTVPAWVSALLWVPASSGWHGDSSRPYLCHVQKVKVIGYSSAPQDENAVS